VQHDLCRVSESPLSELGDAILSSAAGSVLPPEKYTLPDGKEILITGTERAAIPELLFDPFYYGSTLANGVSDGEADNGGINKVREARGEAAIPGATVSLPQVLLASAMACEPEIRRDLIGNLVLTGGASAMRGLQDRLINEFAPMAPVGTKAKWAAANEKERPLGAWLGGSILGSLGGFGEMCFSRSEYQESGAKAVHLKCV
jgi:actin, other eukaryote